MGLGHLAHTNPGRDTCGFAKHTQISLRRRSRIIDMLEQFRRDSSHGLCAQTTAHDLPYLPTLDGRCNNMTHTTGENGFSKAYLTMKALAL